MTDIVDRLRAGEWGADVEGADEIKRLRKPLEQIRQVCADNASEGSNHKMALNFVHQIAIRTLKEQK